MIAFNDLTEAIYTLTYSYSEVEARIWNALRAKFAESTTWAYPVHVWDGRVVYRSNGKLYECSYTDDGEKVTLGDATEVQLAYTTKEASMHECELEESFIDISEAAKKSAGGKIKIIAPGQGSTAYYTTEALKNSGPKVFKKGLQMFWNHQTKDEEKARPEGDLRDLAGVLESDAEWDENGAEGPGLYAEAKWTNAYTDSIKDLAPNIGISIRAKGKGYEGTVGGKNTVVLTEFTAAKSVDFVTRAGAGGKVVELFEAAGRGTSPAEEPEMAEVKIDEKELQTLREAAAAAAQIPALIATTTGLKAALRETAGPNFVRSFLAKPEHNLSAKSQEYMYSQLVPQVQFAESGAVDAEKTIPVLTEAVKQYKEHMNGFGGAATGAVRNLGEGQAADPAGTAGPADTVALQESISKRVDNLATF